MDCRKCLEFLSRFLEGDLPPRMRDLVSSHLEGCPSCAARFRQVSLLTEELKDMEEADLPAHFLVRLNETLDEVPVPSTARKLAPKLAFGLASLTVVLALSILTLRLRKPVPDMASSEPTTSRETLYLSPADPEGDDKAFTVRTRSVSEDSVFYLLPSSPARVRTTLTSY